MHNQNTQIMGNDFAKKMSEKTDEELVKIVTIEKTESAGIGPLTLIFNLHNFFIASSIIFFSLDFFVI